MRALARAAALWVLLPALAAMVLAGILVRNTLRVWRRRPQRRWLWCVAGLTCGWILLALTAMAIGWHP